MCAQQFYDKYHALLLERRAKKRACRLRGLARQTASGIADKHTDGQASEDQNDAKDSDEDISLSSDSEDEADQEDSSAVGRANAS